MWDFELEAEAQPLIQSPANVFRKFPNKMQKYLSQVSLGNVCMPALMNLDLYVYIDCIFYQYKIIHETFQK